MLNRLIILFFTVFCFGNTNAQEVVLVNNSSSDYQIVIPAKNNDSEYEAADVLKRYLFKISGAKLPIVTDNVKIKSKEILIGKTNRYFDNDFNLPIDAFVIKVVNKKVVISGGERKGVLYGVYSFLETYLGVKKYAIDEEFVPSKKNIILSENLNDKQKPAFEFRSTYFLESQNKDYADFHKINYFFENRLYPAHSLAWLLPASKYFNSNPDFFALIKGKRDPDQICFSSQGALKELKKVLSIEMKLNPQNQVWSVSHLDNLKTCECALCSRTINRGTGFSEVLIPFVNNVAKTFPDKTISTLAYNQSILPAKYSKPLANVEIMFCFTNVDRKIPINNSLNKTGQEALLALRKWKEQTNNFFIWDYTVNYFHSLSPFPNIDILKPNLQFFRDEKFSKIFQQGIGPQIGEFSELKSYLISKLLWNPDANQEQIITEFSNAFYGSGSPFIIQYLNALNKNSRNTSSFLGVYTSPTSFSKGFLSENNIFNYKQILEKGLKAVPENSKYYFRISKELLSIDYAEIEIQSEKPNNNLSRRDIRNKIENFVKKSNEVGVKFLRNGELSPSDFKTIKAP